MRTFAIILLTAAAAIGWIAGGGSHRPATGTAPATQAASPPPPSASPVVVDATPASPPPGTVVVPRDGNGHFVVDGEIGGQSLSFVVDSGASTVALSREDAERVGLPVSQLRFTGQAQTAAGPTPVATVTLPSLRVGGILLSNVSALVLDEQSGPALLGQSFLARLDKVSIEGDRMTLAKL